MVALAAAATFVANNLETGSSSGTDLIFPARVNREGPQPQIEVEGSLTHEFGNMTTQKTGVYKWVVKNKGEGDLEIFLAGSNCMCTVAKLKEQGTKETIKPGESTEIEVEWKTKDQVGEFPKNVTIGTNDPARPEFRLNVHGKVHSPVDRVSRAGERHRSRIGDLSNETKKIVRWPCSPRKSPDMKLTSSSPPSPIIRQGDSPFTAEDMRSSSRPREATGLTSRSSRACRMGDIREEVVIETDHPRRPSSQFNLLGTVSGPISVMPDGCGW